MIFMARHSHNSSRVLNQSEISEFIKTQGGSVVDPSLLTFREKYSYFSRARAMIGDGSASMNMILFAPTDCQFVGLYDPLVLSNDNFLDGGFPYTDMIASRTIPVFGRNPQLLQGSPLASCHYNLHEINEIISTLI